MAKEESFDIHSLTFILLFIIAMVFLSPLFGQVNISGKLVAPPPPPPIPSMSMTASSGTALDELPAEPSAPGALADDSLPDEPAAPLAISANSLPAEPPRPGSPRTGSAATSGTAGTGTPGTTSGVPVSGSPSGPSYYTGGGGGSSGQRGSSDSSVRGKTHLPPSAPGPAGSSGSAGTSSGGAARTAPIQPSRAASSLQPIPVKTGPALDTGVVEPVETPLSYPTPLLSSPVVWYAGGGVLGAGFITTGVLLYLKNKRRKNLLSTLRQPGLDAEPFSEQPLLPGSAAAIPPLDFSDVETKEIYDYLHDNATKGYVLDDLKDALAKNGFSQEKIKQVAESLQ
ncbi:hypothetical protein HYU19_01810 [Candidatus Woesearchaeota archaeon]|nr:hypothetical protein [Candidatus Woesearchaeota archaeon]